MIAMTKMSIKLVQQDRVILCLLSFSWYFREVHRKNLILNRNFRREFTYLPINTIRSSRSFSFSFFLKVMRVQRNKESPSSGNHWLRQKEPRKKNWENRENMFRETFPELPDITLFLSFSRFPRELSILDQVETCDCSWSGLESINRKVDSPEVMHSWLQHSWARCCSYVACI